MNRHESKLAIWCFSFCLMMIVSMGQVAAEEDKLHQLEQYIERFIEEQQIPGTSIAIVHEGELFYANAWGITGESEEPVTTETPFTLGSISKSLTGLGVMKLVEGGAVDLEDPIHMYLPSFDLQDQQAASQITIKQLLTHTSGFSTYSGLAVSDKESKDAGVIKKHAQRLLNEKLSAGPGEKYQYSNANFIILGALIEEVTNQTYSEFMEKEVFTPLGMDGAAADEHTADNKGYKAGHQSWLGLPQRSHVNYDNGGAPYGYIVASTTDMVQYLSLLHSRERPDFLSEEMMNLYVSPHVQTGEDRYYGFGVRVTAPYSNEEMIWHSGSTPDSRSEIFYIPETGWGGVILTNKNHILEEDALAYLKHGIINILNGEEAVKVPTYFPLIQMIIIALLCFLTAMFIYIIVKSKSAIVRKKALWRSLGIILVFLSITIIPLLLYFVGVPWHTIKGFATDVAWLTITFSILSLVNGILLIGFSFKAVK
ncbi:serine hydrolase [Alkalihalophilus lindianensis]|uniref:Serine hydrolase n=1 Tax=Alkalihalophilus lindianensis TaxID=1630542 RepID=A0ABU3X4G6_9BACI|nr:serine hydrolase [Alkalihalophilus lindianensis]MDV2682778.1 serine hydrolase [Alkalihalophilus lindianensis]